MCIAAGKWEVDVAGLTTVGKLGKNMGAINS